MRGLRFFVCLMIGAIGIHSLPASAGGDGSPRLAERTVHGTVVATDTKADPKTIVVKVPLSGKRELIVGASVPPGIHISRRGRLATLEDIKPGDKAELSYQKSPAGLTAQLIHIR